MTSSPRPPKPPRTKESRYSRCNLAKKEVCFHIRLLKPLQTEKEEEKLKGKICEKTIASSHSSRQSSEEDLSSYAVNSGATGRKMGQMCSVNHAKNPESLNYDVMNDDAICNGDVIDRAYPINKFIAGKRETWGQPSVSPIVRFFSGINKICNKTIATLALILAIVTNVIWGGLGINSVERLRIVGLSNTRWLECERNFRHHNFRLLRTMTTAITSLWLESGNNIPILIFHKRKSGISRDKSRIENSIGIYGKNFRPVISCFSCYATREPRGTLWDVFGGKTFVAYICPIAAFYAFCLGDFISYTRNMDFGYRFHTFLNLIYIFMHAFWRSWASCNWSTYLTAILHTLVYFSLNSCHWVTKSHDKYQSMILIGLALAEKAYVGFRCFLLHYRSYWGEWRPLVTPWARCIKEDIEPWAPKKWSFTSHAQLLHLAPR